MRSANAEVGTLRSSGPCVQLLQEEDGREALAAVLPDYLRRCRWFGGKARQIHSATMVEAVRFSYASAVAYMTALRIDYTEGDPETYVLPLLVATGETLARVQQELPHAVVARVTGLDGEGLFYEAVWDNDFSQALLEAIVRRRRFKGIRGELVGVPTRALPQLRGLNETALMPSLLKAEQSNTSVIYGDKLILKLFRRVGEGSEPRLGSWPLPHREDGVRPHRAGGRCAGVSRQTG